MDADSLYLALAEKKYDCVRSDQSQEWKTLGSKDCKDLFTADAGSNFFRACAVLNTKIMMREPGLFEEEFRCIETCVCSRTYCRYDSLSSSFKLSSKGSKQANN